MVGVADGGEYVDLLQGGDQFFAVGTERGDGLVPGFGVGRFGRFRPVAVGEIRRFVLGVESVFDDVPLRDTKMLDKLVGRVGETAGALAAKIGGKVFDGGGEAGVGVVFGEKRD